MNSKELAMLQALPLEIKIRKSKQRIIEWIEHYGQDSIYCSFSGGLGSTVLYFLLQEIFKEQGFMEPIPCLFANTRNELPSIVHHVYSLKGQYNAKYRKIMGERTYDCPNNYTDSIVIRKPKMFMHEVVQKEGYLVVSKTVSRCICDLRKLKDCENERANIRRASLLNTKNYFSVPNRYQYLIDAEIKISIKCCILLKHSVYRAYEKETGRIYPITGEQACESKLRKRNYLKFGCNGFAREKPRSTPLGFWTQHDLLEYLLTKDLPYAKDYGDIVMKNGRYITTDEQRTGCACCFANLSSERRKSENRFQRMERKSPNLYKYVFKPLDEGGLGGNTVLDIMHIPYHAKKIIDFEVLVDLFNNLNN